MHLQDRGFELVVFDFFKKAVTDSVGKGSVAIHYLKEFVTSLHRISESGMCLCPTGLVT